MQCVHLYMCRYMCVRYMHLLDKSRIAYRLIFPLRNFATYVALSYFHFYSSVIGDTVTTRQHAMCCVRNVTHPSFIDRVSKSHRRKGGEDPLVKPRNRFQIVRRESQYPCKSKMEHYRVSRREQSVSPIINLFKVNIRWDVAWHRQSSLSN